MRSYKSWILKDDQKTWRRGRNETRIISDVTVKQMVAYKKHVLSVIFTSYLATAYLSSKIENKISMTRENS